MNIKSKLYDIVKQKKIKVNSAHHQSVKVPGKGLTVSAIASDGVIEGIEDHTKKFCHGVQWHPEFLIKSSDKKNFSKVLLKHHIKSELSFVT